MGVVGKVYDQMKDLSQNVRKILDTTAYSFNNYVLTDVTERQ